MARVYEKINGIMLIIMGYTIGSDGYGMVQVVAPSAMNPLFISFYITLIGFCSIVYKEYQIRSIINVLSAVIWTIIGTSAYMHYGLNTTQIFMFLMMGANLYLFAYQGVMGTNKL